MAFGNRTLKFDTLALANPVASVSIAQQEVSASNLNIDPAVVKTGTLDIISSNNLGNDNIELFQPINTGDIVVGEPSDTESPLDESPTDDSGEVEEPLADVQTETETETEQTEPEYQPEEEAKTNISGGTTEIGFPAWFENSLKKGGMIAGLGVLGFIGYKVADATGVIDKITEKKPAAKTPQKKDKMMAETFNAPMLMCGDCGGDRFICRECGYCPDCYCDIDCFDQKNPNPVLMKEKIINSLKREIKDLQNQKMELEEYMDYNFTPPAMWEYDLHEQKSIEPFSPQRLSRMNKFYQKELDRINDINAQIEDLISYLGWIDEFYGTREE